MSTLLIMSLTAIAYPCIKGWRFTWQSGRLNTVWGIVTVNDIPPEQVRQDLRAIGETDQDLWGQYWDFLHDELEDHGGGARQALLRAGFQDEEANGYVDDVWQEASVRFKKNASRIRATWGLSSVVSWAHSTIRHIATDSMRERARGKPVDPGLIEEFSPQYSIKRSGVEKEEEQPKTQRILSWVAPQREREVETPIDKLTRVEKLSHLWQAPAAVMGQRNERHQVIIQRYRDGDAQVDIARDMGLEENTINQICHRFRDDLETELRQIQGEESWMDILQQK